MSRRPLHRRMWQHAPGLTVALAAALVLSLVFAFRLTFDAMHWHDTPENDPLAGWMTPRYVAHSWAVPPTVIREALAIPSDTRRMTVSSLADERGMTTEEVILQIEAAIAAFRAQNPQADR